MSDNIKVVVKVRPLISRELEKGLQNQWRVNNNTLYQLDSNGRDIGQSFTFDKVYSENTKTSDVYKDVAKPIIEAAVAGFNGTIFAYGQTSSGKTYTMTGTDNSPGIIPLAVVNLFEIIKNEPGRDFVVSVSYIEIYNETVRDLLDLNKVVGVQQTYDGGTKVIAMEKVTASPDEVLEAMKEGNANRQTASTNMNDSSSRSHSIFQINIESREHIEGEEQAGCVNVSQLNLVDLAGSERAGQTGATGLRFREGTAINKSLSSLGLVIKYLSEEPNRYINYRDSKLTRILQNSLGGNAKTSIICAITPAALHAEETNSTLQFATRAKAIKNKPEVNAVATDATMIQRLTKQLSTLQSQLETKKNLEVMLETKKNVEQDLQKQIANLQRFILNGFGQRPNAELIGGARRNLQPPRRMTISTLHPIEENIPYVPKFSTPSLKYNPSLLQSAGNILPIINSRQMSSLPEEPPRLVTPPPTEPQVIDEVIELDSDDDDNSSDHTSCSPYHKCYSDNKTPPCVLRKNAKQAEKSFKDLVELTDREKMYTPSVVELIEKIELSTTKTAKLEDEIEILKTISKEKDLEIEILKRKINTTEDDIKSFTSTQMKHETQRKELNTKLTDWEVTYETLKNKAKLREQELLSLLEEQRLKQAEDIGKMPSKPQDKEVACMDMSKDISLVHSDNENSIIISNEAKSCECTHTKSELTVKNQIISDLEADINDQKQQIQRLEKSSQNLLSEVDGFKKKLCNLENENILLQSTVNELNGTIKSQKENLELAQNDIKSYDSVIAELKIKLSEKEKLLDVHISDVVLESMLTNEDKTIANNENIKHIIHAFKLALANSKKEIDLLKSKIQNSNESRVKDEINDLQLDIKKQEIVNNEISKLKKQADENMVTINTLLRDKKDLALIEQELVKKISEMEHKNSEYDILSKEQSSIIDTLKKENARLETDLTLKRDAEKEYLQNMKETLIKLEDNIKMKDTQISQLNMQNNQFQDCLNKAQLAINKLQDIFIVLTGDVGEIPEILDNFVVIYNTLYENLNILENIAVETVSQKNASLNDNIKLKNEMTALILQNKSQMSEVTKETEILNDSLKKLTNDITILNEKNNEQSNEIEKLKHELDTKNIELDNSDKHLKLLEEANNNIRAKYSDNCLVISSLKEKEVVLLDKIEELKAETISSLKSTEDINKNLSNKEEIYKQKLCELEHNLQQKCIEVTQANQNIQENNELVANIIRKLTSIMESVQNENLSLKNSLICEHSNILPILDAVLDHIILLQSPFFVENKELKSKIEDISSCNKGLERDLEHSSELLYQIQKELKMKTVEMNTMELKAKEWKKQFIDFDMAMKEQMLFLKLENDKLKTRLQGLQNETKMQIDSLATDKSYKTIVKSNAEYKNDTQNSLPSLFTISFKKVMEVIDQKQNDNISATTSRPCVGNHNTTSSANTCPECNQLMLELRTTQQENIRLKDILQQVEDVNKELLKEHSEMSDEVCSLLELTEELQKKVVNHRTNLSILTATSYAENKSLKSQVKGLQHHHIRFHNVCQRDIIPEFKKQLSELLGILKDDSSYCDNLNFSYTRSALPNLLENLTRNESTFDCDLLMLDTNVTLTTADNTQVECNQTCLDLTQNTLNETDCQTIDHNRTESNMLRHQMDVLKNDNYIMSEKLKKLQEENLKWKERGSKKYLDVKELKDAQSSPIKMGDGVKNIESQKYLKELELLTEKLLDATKQKKDIEIKYNDLILEMPSTDALVHKMKSVEEDLKNKTIELSKLTDVFKTKSAEMKDLQEENDVLSTQVMEHISEADDLNKEVEQLKKQNLDLLTQCKALEVDYKLKLRECSQCGANVAITNSRRNQFEDVPIVKPHLDRNMSMDLDGCMNYELASESSLPSSPQSKKCNMPDIQEEKPLDLYITEKNDCFQYYLDTTGIDRENLSDNAKIIDVMKLLHQHLITSHGNEVENLSNKVKDYQESQTTLQRQILDMNAEYSKVKICLEERDKRLNCISNVIIQLRNNLSNTKPINITPLDFEAHEKLADVLKFQFLTVLDEHFNLSSLDVYEQIAGYTKKLLEDYNSVSDILTKTKYHLSEKEKEYNLLKSQNDKIKEINNAVTLDIIRKEHDNKRIITETYQKLVELDMIHSDIIPLSEPMNVHVLIRLLQHFINEYQKEKAKAELALEMDDVKVALTGKDKQLKELQVQNELLQSINNKNAGESSKKDNEIKKLKELNDELNSDLNIKIDENARTVNAIQIMSKEINEMIENIKTKDQIIVSLSDKNAKANELLNTVKILQDENNKLKAVNEMISKETKSYALELEKSCETIKQNNIDIDKMTSDILVLRESLKEATTHMEQLKQEEQKLAKENVAVKQELLIKSQDCSRLEINIKTHEKTAEIQSRMIMRLQKLQKESDDKTLSKKLANELAEKYSALQTDCEELKNTVKALNNEIEHLKSVKQSLESRITEAEETGRCSRLSIETIADSSKRRRQSLHDSKRLFEELEEHNNLEAVFESRQKSDDFFNEEDSSGRSTPFGLGKGRDSLLSKTNCSDKDEEHSSRPSSVLARATRRRRQSSHDLHRSVTPHAQSPTDLSNDVIDELEQLEAGTSRNILHSDNEVVQLRTQLASCQQELEELKERFRELDEECETCAEYLRARDEQCSRLKKEKAALEKQIMELKSNADTAGNRSNSTPKVTVAHVSVNTDEDWTNLHAVVVDRMSYDAEVEKNKKLAKTIEELRFTKLDLKNTLAKMQKALEKNSAKDNSRELEHTRKQLKASNDELKELRARFKELDEECETCAKYLKEREEQCRRLKEAKAILETKLEELQEKSLALEHTKTVRKKRQTFHDLNRPETSAGDQTDACTETTEDLLSLHVERDESTQGFNESSNDADYLRKMVGRLTQQKMQLEMQLQTAYTTHPMFVATGSAIVQNQQITDVMKENQKLKKINAKLVNICKKRGKSANRENEDPSNQG